MLVVWKESRSADGAERGEVGLRRREITALVLREHDGLGVAVVVEAERVPELVREDTLELGGTDKFKNGVAQRIELALMASF